MRLIQAIPGEWLGVKTLLWFLVALNAARADPQPFREPVTGVEMVWKADDTQAGGGFWTSKAPYKPTALDTEAFCRALTYNSRNRGFFPDDYAFALHHQHLVVKHFPTPGRPAPTSPPANVPRVPPPSVVSAETKSPQPTARSVPMREAPPATPRLSSQSPGNGLVKDLGELPPDLQQSMRGLHANFPGKVDLPQMTHGEAAVGAPKPLSEVSPEQIPVAIRPPAGSLDPEQPKPGFVERVRNRLSGDRKVKAAMETAERAQEKALDVQAGQAHPD